MKKSNLIGLLLAVTSVGTFAKCDLEPSNISLKNNYASLEVISCDRAIDDNKNSLSKDASICIKKYNRISENKYGKMYDVFVSGRLSDDIVMDTDNGNKMLEGKDMSFYSDAGFRGLSIGKGIMSNRIDMHIHRNSNYLSVTKKNTRFSLAADALFYCSRTVVKDL